MFELYHIGWWCCRVGVAQHQLAVLRPLHAAAQLAPHVRALPHQIVVLPYLSCTAPAIGAAVLVLYRTRWWCCRAGVVPHQLVVLHASHAAAPRAAQAPGSAPRTGGAWTATSSMGCRAPPTAARAAPTATRAATPRSPPTAHARSACSPASAGPPATAPMAPSARCSAPRPVSTCAHALGPGSRVTALTACRWGGGHRAPGVASVLAGFRVYGNLRSGGWRAAA